FGDDSEVIWHPDVTSVDSSAPLMSAIVMPEYSRQRVQVGWLHAPDTGGTGTYGYDVDVQEYPGGPWEALSRQQTQNEIDESFVGGKAYRFRVRALDGAYNYSAWLVTMPTNVYTWKVESHVVDNRGNALPYATVTTNPPSFVAFEGNAIYHNYVGD